MQGEKRLDSDDPKWSYHSWLQRGNLIIDITADQFEEISEQVIVSTSSRWHENLEVDESSGKIAEYKSY